MTGPSIMVTGANGDVGEAIGRILREFYPRCRLTGADAGETWPGELAFDDMKALPRADDADYPETLRAVFEAAGADLLIPCSDAEQMRIATRPEALRDLPILALQADLVAAFCDKLATAEWLAGKGIPVARTRLLSDASAAKMLPAVVKPRTGQGSKDIHLVRSSAHLADLMAHLPAEKFVIQSYLEDEGGEFTCAIVGWQGDTRRLAMRRTLVGGLTGRAVVVEDAAIDALLADLIEAADPIGPLNVQLRLTRDGPFVFEINPRFSSTVMMRHRIGFSDVVWAVDAWLSGKTLPVFTPPVGARMARLSREAVKL